MKNILIEEDKKSSKAILALTVTSVFILPELLNLLNCNNFKLQQQQYCCENYGKTLIESYEVHAPQKLENIRFLIQKFQKNEV